MSVLQRDRNVTVLRPAGRFNRRLGGLALVYGAVGAVALALVLLVPSLVAWTADSRSSVSWLDAMSFAGDGWVLAHHGSLRAPAGSVTHVVTFAPLIFTALALWCARAGAKALLREVEHEGRDAGRWWHPVALFIGGYLIAGLLLAVLGATGTATPRFLTVIPGAIVVAAAGFGWALRAEPDAPAYAVCADWWERVPDGVRRGVRPACEAALALFAVATLVLVLLVATHTSRIGQVNGLLGPGAVGTVILALAQLASVPNMVVLITGWTSGASVHVGTATVSAGAVHTGLLPSIPVLGAIPDPGAFPVYLRVVPLVVVLAGGYAGARAAGALSTLSGLRTKLTAAASAAGLLTVGMSLLAWIAGAHVSGAPLARAQVGLVVLPLFALEFVVGALVAAAALHYIRVRRSHV
ncbi:DUF6350 family protein [Allobranchiibius sp. GilTou38]|uniref:cell division protein PerM n=2 Tax=unclassified Allobranchiibius TaxID=2649857 RepID=UPI001AA17D67|nr:DUF6350 family protein [Allobranchiibius sp. GilTou38]MBO1767952.1 hypothetical protein [Allobranchiibius sp. GilTou38]